MKKICAMGPTVKGVDVSHYQPVIDWKMLKKEGYEFAFLKATEGLSFKDKMYLKHKVAAQDAGLLVGAYHFFRPNLNAEVQAKHFCDTAGMTNLPLVFDWEVSDGVPSEDDRNEAKLFLNTVERIAGHVPIVYTGPYFAQDLRLGPDFKKYPLWVAHYGTKCPLVPQPWENWTFHQYTDKGSSVGIAGPNEDANVYNGTLEQLKKFALVG